MNYALAIQNQQGFIYFVNSFIAGNKNEIPIFCITEENCKTYNTVNEKETEYLINDVLKLKKWLLKEGLGELEIRTLKRYTL